MKPRKKKTKKTKKSAKVLPIVLAASISTEAVLSMRHHDGVEPQHTETSVKPPSNITATVKSSGGTGRAVSATLAISPHEALLPEQPHIEPAGGGQVTDFTLNQIG
jgi:hypothetical protein